MALTEQRKLYLREYNRKQKLLHPEKIRKQRQQSYLRNKTTRNEKTKQWRKQTNARCERAWRKKNPFRVTLTNLRNRAKKHNLSFDLTAEYLEQIWTGICPVFKTEIKTNIGNGNVRGMKRNSRKYIATVDKIDPTKGYVKGNVQWISQLANSLKQDATLEELDLFSTWWLQIKVDKQDPSADNVKN